MAVDSQEAIRVAFLLEPGHGFSGTDGFDYLGARRFLLKAKAQDGTLHRQHWQHVSGVGYADFRAFLRAQRDTWRREREGERDGEREASREEERSAAAAAPYADAAPSSHSEAVAAGQKDQGEVDVGEAGTGEVVERKDSLQEVVGMVKIQAEGMISVAYREDQVEGGEEGKGEGGEGQSKVPAASATAMAEGTIASDADASTHDVPGVGGTAGSVAAAPSAAADTFNRTELALPSVSTSSSSFDSVAAAVAAALGNAAPVPFTSESAPTVSAVPSTAADTFNCSDGNTKGDAPPSASSSGVDSIAAAVAAALGKAEPAVATASEAAPAADGHGSEDADSRRAAGADSGRAASREGLEGGGAQRGSEGEEVAIRVSAASGASAGGEESDGERAAEGGGKGEAAAAAAALDSKQQDSKQPSTPPSPPPLPAGFSSSICSVPPEASRNVLPPPPPRSGSVGSADSSGKAGGAGAEGKKGARRGSEGAAGREGSAAGRPLERRKSVGETAGSGGKGGVETGPLVRMSAVFEDCLASVNKVQFSRHHPDLLAYGAADGTFRLCYVPCNTGGSKGGGAGGKKGALGVARVKHELKGHTKEVTDFDWSTDDDYLCSSSADKSVRVWDVGTGQCLRIIYTLIPQTCIIFHPQNNNFLVVANSKKELTVMNFSTGRVVSRVAMDSNVTALVADRTTAAAAATSTSSSGSSGGGSGSKTAAGTASRTAAAAAGSAAEVDSVVFVGDSEGAIHSFTVDKQSGSLQRRHRTTAGVVHPAPVASLHFSPTSVLANGPVLLACSKDGCVRFYTTALELNGYLFLKISLQLSSRATNMNAAFCPPLGPSESGEYIVTGNADHHVYFYDFMKPRSPLVARVPGHKAMVVDVSWNNTNTVLASCDCDGVVALWQRA